jgi:hypothetical protein
MIRGKLEISPKQPVAAPQVIAVPKKPEAAASQRLRSERPEATARKIDIRKAT